MSLCLLWSHLLKLNGAKTYRGFLHFIYRKLRILRRKAAFLVNFKENLGQIKQTSITINEIYGDFQAICPFLFKNTSKIDCIKLFLKAKIQNKIIRLFLKELFVILCRKLLHIKLSFTKMSQLLLETMLLD